MKEKWKVYIKGVPGRGDEVIKILEDLGAKNSFDYDGNKLVYLYYIWHDGSIHVELIDNEYGQIIMDNYRELHLPEKWKDGNILFSPRYKRFAIYAYEIPVPYLVVAYYCFDENFLTHSFPRIKINDFRLATSQEIVQFHKLLHKHGKDWDSEKKQLIKWKWKPKDGEDYWTVILDITLYKLKLTWVGGIADEVRYELGNCFRTSEEADAMLNKIKNSFKEE